jgi:hypothetical protein
LLALLALAYLAQFGPRVDPVVMPIAEDELYAIPPDMLRSDYCDIFRYRIWIQEAFARHFADAAGATAF